MSDKLRRVTNTSDASKTLVCLPESSKSPVSLRQKLPSQTSIPQPVEAQEEASGNTDSRNLLIAELRTMLTKKTGRLLARTLNEKPKPWQRELARQQQEFERTAAQRQEAEAKEDARVAAALAAEATKKQLAMALAAEKVKAEELAKAAVTIKRDENGIPLPPPLPPVGGTPSVRQPQASNTSVKADIIDKKENNPINKQLVNEMKLTLSRKAQRTPAKTTQGKLKPWQRELIGQQEAYERAATKRQEAEAQEEARVAAALAAESAAVAAKAAANKMAEQAKTDEIARAIANTRRDDKGIPLPPPLPPLFR